MKFDGSFKFLGQFNVTGLPEKILSLDENEWHKMSWKERRGKEHSCTQTIPILFDSDFRHIHPTRHSTIDTIDDEFKSLRYFMEDYYGDRTGYFIRMIIVRMNPQSEIPLHYDTGSSLPYAHRIHLPVKTNDAIIFKVGGESKNLKNGELWEINNQRQHGVRNLSDEARIHIIMDWVTSDLIALRKNDLGIEINEVGTPPKADSRVSR
jgi:hypothetical protein